VTTDRPLPDAAARELIARALDETLVVEAAAGTGKTTALVGRLVRVLAEDRARVHDIVAVTFTEKAAGELKLRLRQDLESARASADDAGRKRRLEHALAHLEDAHVSTIHGFCAELLRERPVEAGVDPLFTVLTEEHASRLYDEAFDVWFQASLADPPEGVRRSLRRLSRFFSGDDDGPVERLRRAGRALLEWRDFPAAWTRPAWSRLDDIAALAAEVRAFAELRARASSRRDPLYTSTEAAARTAEALRLLEADGGADADGGEALLVDLAQDTRFCQWVRKGSGASFGPDLPRTRVLEAHADLVQALERFRADADADLAALLRDELRGAEERYVGLKARAGALDFLDLLLLARNLVRDHAAARAGFQQRFARIFVDEFQDTDPLQAEILLLLAASDPAERDWTAVTPAPGKLFIVGDPKQSIYRFRRADVETYNRVCLQVEARGATRVQLTTSFRAVPAIQHAVNAAFAPLMQPDARACQAGYVPLDRHRLEHPGQPAVVALPVPRPYGTKRLAQTSVDASCPDAVGAFIAWLVRESGWTVTERRTGDERVPVAPRHICILFRKMVRFDRDLTRPYVDALEARGVHHLLVGGRTFHEREEIETLRAALTAIEWPDDELSVFATLRGGLYAIPDEDLLEYTRSHPRGLHPFRVPADLPEHLKPIGEALELLASLHRGRNRRPVAETIARLLAATRAHAGLVLRQGGAQVLANVLHVSELARQFEMSGGVSFRGFVDELREAAERGRATEAPILEEGSDGVRLMTVHKAKGLEFPVVILADVTVKLSASEADRHLDPERGLCALRIGGWSPRELLLQQPLEQERDRQEGIRVAYVASTRARDLLVVPAVGDGPFPPEGWVGPLDRVLYPPVEARQQARPAPGAPLFLKDSVLERPDDEPARPDTVRPGLHLVPDPVSGATCEVVWWDPRALALDADPPLGLQRQELIVKDVPGHVVDAGKRRYHAWRDGRDQAVAAASRPTLEVRTATGWAFDADGTLVGDGVVDVQQVNGHDGDRPSGARFGALVHACLAAVDFTSGADGLDALVAAEGRIAGATDDEVAAAGQVVARTLSHPLLERARAAARLGHCRRETPVTVLVGGLLVEGVPDLVFEEDEGFVVVDFKTDREIGDAVDRYRRQVALYAHAVTEATGRPARAVLLRV